MKINWTLIITLGLFLLVFGWLVRFGLSDFWAGASPMNEILETKPWRPWCRAIFSIVMGALLIVGTVGFLKIQANS